MQEEILDTAKWIDSVYDAVPVEHFFDDVEYVRHPDRDPVDPASLAVPLKTLERRRHSLAGPYAVSEYAAATAAKRGPRPRARTNADGEVDVPDGDPKEELRKRLRAKLAELRSAPKGRRPKDAEAAAPALPETKKHVRAGAKPGKGGKAGKHGKAGGAERDAVHSPKAVRPRAEKAKGKAESRPPTSVSPALRDSLEFGTIEFTSGKNIPRYLSKKKQ